MDVEERLRSKLLYKAELGLLKVIPMLIALGYFLNIVFSYFGIEAEFLSHTVGISFLPLVFLYISSYAFRFCEYHRMFLHYILVNNIITIVDYYCDIAVSDLYLFMVHLIIAGLFLSIILYLKMKLCKHSRK